MIKTEAIDDLIHENNISMKIVKVQANPIIASNDIDQEIEHYRCQLLKPGQEVDVYLSIEPTNDLLTVNDVLIMLAMDASGCQMLEGYGEQKEEWNAVFGGSDGNLDEIEDFWNEYAKRRKQVKKVRNFLGDVAYERILLNMDIRKDLGGLFQE